MDDKKLKIVLVDDHEIITEGLSTLLDTILDCEIIAQLHSGQEAVEFMTENDADIIFMDVMMPGRINGIKATDLIKASKPKTKVVALTMLSDAGTIKKMITAGANGFIIKNSSSKEILKAIDIVIRDQFYIHFELRPKLLLSMSKQFEQSFELTEIEYDILGKIVLGKTTNEIASENFRSTETIKSHRKRILKKLNCRNTAALVRYVVVNRIVEI